MSHDSYAGSRPVRVVPAASIVLLFLAGCTSPEPGPAAKPVHQSRAKSQYDTAVFDRSLDFVRSWHDSTGTAWDPSGGPSPEAVAAHFDDLGFVVNEELRTLWSELAPAPDGPPLFFDHVLLSAETSRERYDALRADHTIPWRPNWIPVFEAGDRWLVVESSRSSAPAGPVVAYRLGETPVVAFTNLTRLFEALATALSDTSSRVVDGAARIDPGVFGDAHRATNPDLPLPSHVTGS